MMTPVLLSPSVQQVNWRGFVERTHCAYRSGSYTVGTAPAAHKELRTRRGMLHIVSIPFAQSERDLLLGKLDFNLSLRIKVYLGRHRAFICVGPNADMSTYTECP